VGVILSENPQLCLMQCNTNYTGSVENFGYVNLNVLHSFAEKWPGMPLGFSDHTPGHSPMARAWSRSISPTTTAAKARITASRSIR
jgi:N-acetylneuraminate synthase